MWRPIFTILFFAPPLFANTLSFTCMEFIVHAEGIYLAFAENQQSKVTETYHYNTNSQTIDIAGTLLDCRNQNEIIHCNRLESDDHFEYSWNLVIDQKKLTSNFHKVGFYADKHHEIKTEGFCRIN